MLERLAGSLLRRRVLVLVVAVAVVGLAGVLGAGVVSKLRSGGFEDPAASSTRAEDALRDTFHTGEPNLVLLVTADHGTVDQADLANGGLELTRRLSAERDVSEVQSYWTTKAAPLRSVDGRQALVLARIAGDDDATQKRAEQLATDVDRDQGGMRVQGGGREPPHALVTTMRTAGRTVLFSAAPVAVALVALLVFPLYFLRSFGYAGIAVVALAAVGALVVLPALLAVLGRRIDSLRLPFGRPAARPAATPQRAAAPAAGADRTVRPAGSAQAPEAGSGAWHRIAMAVMRRPVPIATAVVAVLLVLGAPFLGVRFGLPDDRVLPTSASSLSGLPGVARVDAMTGSYAGGHKLASRPQATAQAPASTPAPASAPAQAPASAPVPAAGAQAGGRF